MHSSFVTAFGYEVETARDGVEALEKLWHTVTWSHQA